MVFSLLSSTASHQRQVSEEMSTHVLKGSTAASPPSDWFDAHPWEEIKPYIMLGAVCMLCGLMMVGRARSTPWLRTPSKVLYIIGLGLLAMSGLMAMERDMTRGVMAGVGFPLALVGVAFTAIYVFSPSTFSGHQGTDRPLDSGQDEEAVPLTDVERELKE